MRFVGGPLDGRERDSDADIITLAGQRGRYVRWWEEPDYPRDWFIRGLPEPEKPERYYRWQPEGEYEEHPAHVAINRALRDAGLPVLGE